MPTDLSLPADPLLRDSLAALTGWLLILFLLWACMKWIPSRSTVIYRPYGYRPDVWFRTRPEWLEAERRADQLLRDVLTSEEYDKLDLLGYLEVPSRLVPNRIYRIPRQPGRVRVYEDNKPVIELCVQAREPMPDGDIIVMHKLMLEGNEREYLRVANRFSCYDGRLARHTGL